MLLDRGAEVNKPDTDGFTPLHEAAIRGQLEVVQFLIERGAKFDTTATGHWSGKTPLHSAAREGKKDVVQLLLDRGAGINKPDTDGFTPLHEAAICGHTEVVQFLIERGAELKGKSGREPYMGRRAKRYIDIIKMLQNATRRA